MHRLAIDFGTSNSAAALGYDGGVYRIPIELGADTLPTAVFFPENSPTMKIGAAATNALIAGEEGRYMRALKSALGLPLLHESRLIGGKRRTLSDIITAFLSEIRTRAETATGLSLRTALSGRPVHFHTADPAKDAQAEADLRACYLAAGFEDIQFMAEPEAAARASHQITAGRGLGLIVDIGGGTSDFSVFHSRGSSLEILTSHGIRLGGTDFDQAVSLAHAMPMLGLGGRLRRVMGEGELTVPRAPFVELATWAKIPFLYTPETRRLAADMVRMAVDPVPLTRFQTVLEHELGHTLAFAVERGKIAANTGNNIGQINMSEIEPGLNVDITPQDLEHVLENHRADLRHAAIDTVSKTNILPADITEVVLVGGSSLMRIVSQEMQTLFPNAKLRTTEAFTAVVDGLAIAAKSDG